MTNTTAPTAPAPSALPLNVASMARQLLTIIGSLLLGKGYITQQADQELIAIGVLVAVAAWNFYKNHNVNQAISAAMQAEPVVLTKPDGSPVPPVAVMVALLLFAPAVLGLAGCGQTALLRAGQTEAVSWTAVDGVSIGVDTLVKAGQLKGADAGAASVALTKLVAAMSAVDSAYAGGSVVNAESQTAVAAGLVAQLTLIITSHGGTVPAAK